MSNNKLFNDADNQLFIYKEGLFGSQAVSFSPTPLVGVSTEMITDKSKSTHPQGTADSFVTYINTITLEGHFIKTPGASATQEILSAFDSKKDEMAIKGFTLELNNRSGQLVSRYVNCNVESFTLDVSNHVNASRFTVTIRSVSYADATSSDGGGVETYDYDFSVSTDNSMGYFNTAETQPVTSSYQTGTETITVVGADSVKALTFAKSKSQYSAGGTVHLEDGMYRPDGAGGSAYSVANIETSSSTNLTEGSVTYTVSFILIPTYGYSQRAIGSVSIEKNDSHDQVETIGTVGGSIQGVEVGGYATSSNLTDIAYSVYNTVYGSSDTLLTQVGIGTVRDDARTVQVSKSHGTGSVDFTIEYDNRSEFQTPNVLYEKIEVSDNPSRQVFAVVPVMGRATGPVLQDTYASTEKRKDVTVEVIFKAGYGSADGGGAIGVLDAYAPSASTSFVSDYQTQYNSSENRFTATKSWVYN